MSPALLYTVLILVPFLLMGSIVRGLYLTGVINYTPSFEGLIRPMLSITLSLALCLMAYISEQKERLISILWVAFVLLFFGGLFIIAALMPKLAFIDSEIVVISRTFLGFFLWVVITNVARSQKTDPIFLLCIFFLITDCVSGLLTNYAVPFLTLQYPGFAEENRGVLALLMAFILLLGSFGVLGTAALKSVSATSEAPDLANGGEKERQEACERISERSKLTNRETEVLYYVSQGHSIKKIAESLFISTSTVQSHVKNLYRKTGLHTRQEVIDCVNDEKHH